ncbi:MAG: hypothetical protein PUA84_08180 [Oscillospiraceae bacterium]|nr:hypothetical protein [Oscillospiraceae bacterium]
MKRKNKVTSALGVIVSIILVIVAAATLLVTILFAKKDTPELFGYYLYLQKSSAMEVADSADDSASIHANTVVFAKAYNGTDPLSVNNAVLCVLAPDDSSPIEDKDSDGYAIRRILDIKPNEETGELLYYPTTMQTDRLGTEPPITGSSIIGICEFEHSGLYSYITFVQTLPGILLLLALPCVLLIAMIVMKIVRSRNRRLDENAYAFEESYDEVPGEDAYDEDYSDEEMDEPMDEEDDYSENYAHEQSAPLYTPEISSTSTLDRKRISIAQNFTPKAVNPNSPYQKARTMQFKAQKDVPILNTAPYDQPQQSYDNEYVGKYSAGSSASSTASNEQPVYHGAHEAGGTSGGRVFRSNSSITSTIRKPNVDDILNGDPLARAASEPAPKPAPAPEKKPAAPSYSSGKRRNPVDSASVDDLLAMIADQKKKL